MAAKIKQMVWVDDELSFSYGFPPFRVPERMAKKFARYLADYVWADDMLSLKYGFPPYKVRAAGPAIIGKEFSVVDDELSRYYGFPPLKVKKGEVPKFARQ